ncbi:MAG: HAMP domain-containing protein [bacterium]|nr:HAMP domain-containing protein [bacterium]
MPIRDPLSLLPVRFKLPLTFAFFCAVAFGLGGYLVTTVASEALERQITLRLNDRATRTDLVIDKDLELLGRRVEDFASDGHIRLMLERLVLARSDNNTDEEAGLRAELVRHLRVNKLPLVAEFADAYLLDETGLLLLSAFNPPVASYDQFDPGKFWYGPLSGPEPDHPHPNFVLSTPVRAIEGAARIGTLQIMVRADVWANHLQTILAEGPLKGLRIGLGAPGGYHLPLYSEESESIVRTRDEHESERRISFSSPNARTGWLVDASIDRRNLTLPINTLVWKFVYVGLALPVLMVLLLLPLRQFLLKPLAALQTAATRISGGDFSARVGYESEDEVGHLSRAFDSMAEAVEEVTRSLARVADDLRISEAEIRHERDRLNTVIHSMEDGLFILDCTGKITLRNEAASEVLAELQKGRIGTGSRACAKNRHDPRTCFACLSSFGHPRQSCTVMIGAGTWEINATPIKTQEGEEVARVFVSRDVSERVQQAAQQAHQERLSVLGEVAAVMAHEMNNPLAAISMFSQMLLKGLDSDSPLRTHAEVVNRNTESCKRAIRSLLDMATTSPSEAADFDVRDTVDDVAQLLRPIAERKNTVLRVQTEADNGLVFDDELRLHQALVNLVMNAIQAVSGGGGGIATIGTEDRGKDIAIMVADNGPGIPLELRERVFEPFFTTKPPGEGTGLGLPTTKRIVSSLGGLLHLSENPGGGTIFEIVIQRRKPRERTPGTIHDPIVDQPSNVEEKANS